MRCAYEFTEVLGRYRPSVGVAGTLWLPDLSGEGGEPLEDGLVDMVMKGIKKYRDLDDDE